MNKIDFACYLGFPLWEIAGYKLIERTYKYFYFLVADINLYLNWTFNRNMIHCAKYSKSYKLIMRIHSSRGQRETLSDFSRVMKYQKLNKIKQISYTFGNTVL